MKDTFQIKFEKKNPFVNGKQNNTAKVENA